MKQQFVGGGFDRDNYRGAGRFFATAKDGTQIPISLVYRVSDGGGEHHPRPLLMEGYGSYGDASDDVYFSTTRLCLLERGVAACAAVARGSAAAGIMAGPGTTVDI